MQDWRNAVTFSFDVGMVIRGLLATREYEPEPVRRLLSRNVGLLAGFRDESGILTSHVVRTAGAAIPRKWSTTPGPHHVKVAAGLAGLQGVAEVAEATIHRWLSFADRSPLDYDLHPTLYFLEGAVQLAVRDGRRDCWQAAYRLFQRVLELQLPSGGLPEHPASKEQRSDVIAQALRIGTILAGYGAMVAPDSLAALAGAYQEYVRHDGAVAFRRPESDGNHWNAWAAMFGLQALWCYERYRRGASIPEDVLLVLA